MVDFHFRRSLNFADNLPCNLNGIFFFFLFLLSSEYRAAQFEDYKGIAKEFFYDLPVNGIHGTLSFMVNAVARTVPLSVTMTPECNLS